MSLFDLTLEAHRAGRIDEAECGYRRVIAQEPRHADALHLLGLIRRERGAPGEAQALIESAIAVDAQARFLGSLGAVMLDSGKRSEAEVLYRRAAELDPRDLTAFYNLGVLLLDSGRANDAQHVLFHARALDERFAPTHRELGRAMHALARHDEALACFERAVELDHADALARVGLAAALTFRERIDEAQRSCREAIRLDPAMCDAHLNLGAVLLRQGHLEEAEASLRTAIALDGTHALAHYNLGTVLAQSGRLHAAQTALRHALSLDPSHADSHLNLGRVFERLQRLDDAESTYRDGLALNPAHAGLRANLSLVLLAKGQYAQGWRLYESRFATRKYGPRDGNPGFACPAWEGQPLEGKSLVVMPEQGLGDALQFCRYLPLLKAKGLKRLTVLCAPALTRLFECIAAVDVCLPAGDVRNVPAHDYWVSMMSLPLRFGTTLDTIPAEMPYLRPGTELVDAWKQRLPRTTAAKVGLVWAGERRPDQPAADAIDQRRSLHARQFLPLLRVPGITFVSLQLGATTRPQLDTLPPELRPFDAMNEVTDFADTAAIIEQMDLVIAVDTSTAHLAGALNKPVWILSRYDQCWRWLNGRDDSPWYPSARLFRQREPGGWDDVVARVAQALKGFGG